MAPDISVITPVYNGEKYIKDCIESVAAQTKVRIEHIVIDNLSTDQSLEIAKDYAKIYPHIRLLSCKRPGAGHARNLGMKNATGKYITFLDCDDWWHPEKSIRQLRAMQKHNAAFSWTAYTVTSPPQEKIRVQSAPKHMSSLRHAFKIGTIGCLTACYDREALGVHYMNDMPLRQDFCLWYDILRDCEERGIGTIGINEPLASYRVHSSGMSSNKRAAAWMQWKAYRNHLKMNALTASVAFASYAISGVLTRAMPRIIAKLPIRDLQATELQKECEDRM